MAAGGLIFIMSCVSPVRSTPAGRRDEIRTWPSDFSFWIMGKGVLTPYCIVSQPLSLTSYPLSLFCYIVTYPLTYAPFPFLCPIVATVYHIGLLSLHISKYPLRCALCYPEWELLPYWTASVFGVQHIPRPSLLNQHFNHATLKCYTVYSVHVLVLSR